MTQTKLDPFYREGLGHWYKKGGPLIGTKWYAMQKSNTHYETKRFWHLVASIIDSKLKSV